MFSVVRSFVSSWYVPQSNNPVQAPLPNHISNEGASSSFSYPRFEIFLSDRHVKYNILGGEAASFDGLLDTIDSQLNIKDKGCYQLMCHGSAITDQAQFKEALTDSYFSMFFYQK